MENKNDSVEIEVPETAPDVPEQAPVVQPTSVPRSIPRVSQEDRDYYGRFGAKLHDDGRWRDKRNCEIPRGGYWRLKNRHEDVI